MSKSPEIIPTHYEDPRFSEVDIAEIPIVPVSILACQTLIEEGNRLNTGAPVYNLAKKSGVSPTSIRHTFIDKHGKENHLWQGDLKNEDRPKRYIELTDAGLAYGLSYEPIVKIRKSQTRFSFTDYYLTKVVKERDGVIAVGKGTDNVYSEIYNLLMEEGYRSISFDAIPRAVTRLEEIDCFDVVAMNEGTSGLLKTKSVIMTEEGEDYHKFLESKFNEADTKSLVRHSPTRLIETINSMQEEIIHEAGLLGEDYKSYELTGDETKTDLINIIEQLDTKMRHQIDKIDRRRAVEKELATFAITS